MPGDCSARHSKDQLSAERRAHMRGRGVATCCSAVLFLCWVGATVSPNAKGDPFKKGKTIPIVVGYNPGDAHDLWARAYSRHMGRYIPGNPNIIVRNMPGGGTLIAANYVYGVAEPDGTTLGSMFPSLFFAELTGRQEVKFDLAQFTLIGD